MPTREELLESMALVLGPAGFRKHAATFHRRRRGASFIDTVNLEAGSGSLEGKDPVNLGIYIPEIVQLLSPGVRTTGARASDNVRPKVYECSL
jgi:hypothetical protein